MKRATSSWMALEEEILWGNGPVKIAVIPIQGVISSEERDDFMPSSRRSTTPQHIERYVQRIRHDPSVRGALLIINSPGGGAAASDAIWANLQILKAKHRVVAFIDPVGASGAYYAACAAEHIVASPSALTGSIGVIMQLTEYHEAMQKIGVKTTSLTTGPFKDSGSPHRPFEEADRLYYYGIINDCYERFKEVVRTGRNLSAEEIEQIADGKVFTSRQALEYHLIDEVGYRQTAIAAALRLCEVREATFVRYREKRSPLDLMSRLLPLKLEKGFAQSLADDILTTLGFAEHGPLYLWKP